MTPHTCPVCNGRGTPWVAGDQLMWTAGSTEPHPCQACAGTGVVWGPPEAAVYYPGTTYVPTTVRFCSDTTGGRWIA